MRTLLTTLSTAMLLAFAGCNSDCEKLYNHTIELAEKESLPADRIEAMKSEDEKKVALDACQREAVKSVRCGLAAENLEGVRKCRPHPAAAQK